MIFLDTNVLYRFLVKTKFRAQARKIITKPYELASSLTVLSELVYKALHDAEELMQSSFVLCFYLPTFRG